jgi:hypothetical protein
MGPIRVVDKPCQVVGHVRRPLKTGGSIEACLIHRSRQMAHGRGAGGSLRLSACRPEPRPRRSYCSLQNSWPHALVTLLGDANLNTMRSGAVPAGMREFSIDHTIAPHVSVNERPRSSGVDAAADVSPMHVRNIVEMITSLSPIVVPLAAHIYNLFGFIQHRDRSAPTRTSRHRMTSLTVVPDEVPINSSRRGPRVCWRKPASIRT